MRSRYALSVAAASVPTSVTHATPASSPEKKYALRSFSFRQWSASTEAPRWLSIVRSLRGLRALLLVARPVSITVTTPLAAATARKRESALKHTRATGAPLKPMTSGGSTVTSDGAAPFALRSKM